MLFTHENDFNDVIDQAASEYDVDPAVIKGLIAAESNFVKTAHRDEPKLQDASRGLMQLLGSTARALGYTGPLGDDTTRADGLYEPAVNVHYGTKYIADLIHTAAARGFGLDSAISAYNAGWSAVRPGDGKRTGNTNTAADLQTPFVNQAYVNQVEYYIRHYAGDSAGTSSAPPGGAAPTSAAPPGSADAGKLLALVVSVGVLSILWITRHMRGGA